MNQQSLDNRRKLYNGINFGIQLLLWGSLGIIYSDLPEVVPTHFGLYGADSFGDKSSIFYFLGVGTLINIVCYVLEFFPKLHNYPFEIDRQYKVLAYATSRKFVAELILVINAMWVIIYLCLIGVIVQHITLYMFGGLTLLLIVMLRYFMKIRKYRKRSYYL